MRSLSFIIAVACLWAHTVVCAPTVSGKSIGIGVSMTVVAFLVIGVIVFLLMRLAKKVQNKEYERKREILEAKKNANVADGQTQVDATPGFGGTNAPNVQDQPRQ